MISVCMAVYNGERYLAAQIESILAQLPADAEIIVVDDCSTDHSLGKIRSYGDARIRVLNNPVRRGVAPTFERAIEAARGSIIFLCDQDDVWLPGKVERLQAAFDADANVVLAVSDAHMIDGEGKLVADSYFAQRGGFVAGGLANLLKCRYLGCAMAFRASLKETILPFPDDIPMHDVWIGILAARAGRVVFIDQALLAYRRHQANVTPNRHASLAQMFSWRWRLAKNLLLRWLRGPVHVTPSTAR